MINTAYSTQATSLQGFNMPYVMTRDEMGLKLKQGDKLNYEAGKLPDALKFAANWVEPEAEEKAEKLKK